MKIKICLVFKVELLFIVCIEVVGVGDLFIKIEYVGDISFGNEFLFF